ncbi:hypothetical protein C2845_PM05G15740 [Panicum miliaceum]|uniref:RNase H type-1 domain-containing protein n=1 Tax=Panicum miliaceum TaxID=4540 RepID=A0A3L6T0B9_PANMI|nr:hypothetical protein C2845_PM05G15740 [Panicum miliaceum]
MEAVEGMLKHMQLSEAEKKGNKIGSGGPARAEPPGPRAIGKGKEITGKEGVVEIGMAGKEDQVTEMVGVVGDTEKGGTEGKKKKVGTYKKVVRASAGAAAAPAKSAGRKRGAEEGGEHAQKEGKRQKEDEEMTAEEFMKIAATEHPKQIVPRKMWERPSGEGLKINSDGAFNPVTKAGGWGYVIRDSEGVVIHAGAGVVQNAMDALHVEVLGCLAGVRAAGDRGMMQVTAETDSMILKMALGGGDSLAPTGGLVHEIRAIAAALFMVIEDSKCLFIHAEPASAAGPETSPTSSDSLQMEELEE